jgi:CO dehydrogenase/acetyl-CoA synthase beta subunit
MNVLEAYVERLREYESELVSKGRDQRIWFADPLGHPRRRSGGDAAPLILKENTAVELGGPRTAGSSFILCTEDPAQAIDGRIALIGPDVPQLRQSGGKAAPFGQVVLAGGPGVGVGTYPELERALHSAARIPGYMVRGGGDRIWARVSAEACDAGFSFRALGGEIIGHIRGALAGMEAAEVLFVTSSAEDVAGLEAIGCQVRKLCHDLRRQRLKLVGDGVYECEAAVSCEVCPDSPVCAEIRQMVVIRKKGEEAQQR